MQSVTSARTRLTSRFRSQRRDERSSLKVLTKTHKMVIYSNIQLYGYVVVTYYTSLLWANI